MYIRICLKALTTYLNALIFGREHPWGKEIQLCSNEAPRVMYGPAPKALNFYIVIYKEMLKKIFFSRTAAPNRTIFSMDHP